MKTLEKRYMRTIVNTIVSRLIHTTSMAAINSWHITGMNAMQVVKEVAGKDIAMAALVLQVSGSLYKGNVIVAYNDSVGRCSIYCEREGISEECSCDVPFDELGEVLDTIIDTGIMCE